jgi:ankyrin repeat protein
MGYLKKIDKPQYVRFKTAGTKDLFPMMHVLLLNDLDVNVRDSHGTTPLHCCLYRDWDSSQENNDIGKLLVGFGAEVSRVTVNNDSCLGLTAEHGKDDELFRIILDLDQSMINQLNQRCCTPIFYAAQNGRYAIVDMLIRRGANFRYTTFDESTPALAAVSRGSVDVIKLFLENGMGVDEGLSFCGSYRNWRLIHTAAEHGKTNVLKYLLSKGADPTQDVAIISGEVFYSYTAYDLAKRGGYDELARFIEQAVKEWKQKA